MKKALGKFITALFAIAVVLSGLQVTAYAGAAEATAAPAAGVTDVPSAEVTDASVTPTAEAASETSADYGVEVALYLMESNNNWSFGGIDPTVWSEPVSESVFIKEDGTYTLTLTDLDIPSENLMLCYIKDVAAYPKDTTVTHSNAPDDLMVITDIFKVNGNTKEVDTNKVRTGLKKGIFDVAYRNNWDPNDDCVAFTTAIKSIELTFTVTGITGEPGAIKYEPTKAPAAAVTTAPLGGTDKSADANAAQTSTVETNAADSSTATDDAAAGTNWLVICIAAAAVVISIFVIIMVSRKKK